MRKLTILLSLAAVTATSSGCAGCFGRVRNWFHKGSPCGTNVAAPVLGAPLAMGTPLSAPVAAPMAMPMAMPMMTAPVCCDPCVPCDPCDPCSGAVSMGYGGEMSMGYGGACCDGGAVTSTPVIDGGYLPQTGSPSVQPITPSPGAN